MASEQLKNLTALIQSIKLKPHNLEPLSYKYSQLYDYVKTMREQYPEIIINPRYDRIHDKEGTEVIALSSKSDSNILITNPRIMMTRDKLTKIRPDNAIFNGIVIDVATGSILAIHPRAMVLLHHDISILKDKEHNYTVHKAYDGSLITMYYWNNKWCIASARSVDFSDSCMFGTTKVETIVRDLFTEGGLTFDDLDRDHCYSFVFIHPEWQPRTDKPELYYISSYNTKTCKLLHNIPNVILTSKIKQDINEESANLDTLVARLSDINKSTFTAGVIFRALDSNTHVDYYVESAAMNILRKCIYAPSKHLRTFDQIALKNFLIALNNNALTTLCPQFKDAFMVFDTRVDILITRIITKLYYPHGRYRSSRLETTANYFLSQVKKQVHPNNPNARSIIYDIIVDHQYYDIFESLLLQ